jgi:hypothetical protein
MDTFTQAILTQYVSLYRRAGFDKLSQRALSLSKR